VKLDESEDKCSTDFYDEDSFDLEHNFSQGDCSPPPFLSEPRSVYKSLLDVGMEGYLQRLFSCDLN